MITVTEKEIDRWKSAPQTPMKWDHYPWEVGEKRLPVKVAFGSGLNSTAMLIGCHFQGRPVDKILFADTGGERPITMQHKDRMSDWLQARGYPEIETVFYTNADGERITLEEKCLKEGMLPSLAYGNKACSAKYKLNVQKKHMRNWEAARRAWDQNELVVDLVGYDIGESHRYAGPSEEGDRYRVEYPLVRWRWDRRDCRRTVAFAGLEPPPKSSCFFCPSMNVEEIKRLKQENPKLYERALRLERNAQPNLQEDSFVEGLGGPLSWNKLDKKLETQEELDLPNETPRKQECMCFDGTRGDGDEVVDDACSDEKNLPFPVERAAELDAAYQARRDERDNANEEVDVSVEQLEMTIPEECPPSHPPLGQRGA